MLNYRSFCTTLLTVFLTLVPFIAGAAYKSPLSPAFQKYLKQLNVKAASGVTSRFRSVAIHYTGSCPILPVNLTYGMRGTDVSALQEFLLTQHFLSAGNATGYFGVLTENAVQQFQFMHALVTSGTRQTGFGAVGPKTRAGLAAACGVGASPLAVATSPTVQQQSPASLPEQSQANSSVSNTVSNSTVLPTPPPVSPSPGPTSNTTSNTTNTTSTATINTDTSTATDTSNVADETTLPSTFKTCGTLAVNRMLADQGYAYEILNFVSGGDTIRNPDQSLVVLYQNGLLIGPPDTPLSDIEQNGNGAFLHSSEGGVNSLYFSTPDNTDPRTNGRTYTYGVSDGLCPS